MIPVIVLTIVTVAWAGCATLGEAEGPWRGQVVDAETSLPLEGVVVLAVWERITPGVVHEARDFHDVDEVTTDAEGRFILPGRNLSMANPFVRIEGPKVTMFKAGYGFWQFRPRVRSYVGGLKLLAAAGAVFELTPLKTRDERRRFLSFAAPPSEAPSERIMRYLDAIDDERRFLGLSPLKEDRIRWEKKRKEIGR
jgi:hypothetical protein